MLLLACVELVREGHKGLLCGEFDVNWSSAFQAVLINFDIFLHSRV